MARYDRTHKGYYDIHNEKKIEDKCFEESMEMDVVENGLTNHANTNGINHTRIMILQFIGLFLVLFFVIRLYCRYECW